MEHLAERERYFAQPPVELMRTMIDHGGWYDRKTLKWKQIVDVTLVTAMGPPGGGRQPMTNRMLRQLHMLSFTEMRPEELEAIFVTITSAIAVKLDMG